MGKEGTGASEGDVDKLEKGRKRENRRRGPVLVEETSLRSFWGRGERAPGGAVPLGSLTTGDGPAGRLTGCSGDHASERAPLGTSSVLSVHGHKPC